MRKKGNKKQKIVILWCVVIFLFFHIHTTSCHISIHTVCVYDRILTVIRLQGMLNTICFYLSIYVLCHIYIGFYVACNIESSVEWRHFTFKRLVNTSLLSYLYYQLRVLKSVGRVSN